MTFLIPALMIGVSVVPTMLANQRLNEAKRLLVVAADRDTAEAIRSRIEQRAGQAESQPDEVRQQAGGKVRGAFLPHATLRFNQH